MDNEKEKPIRMSPKVLQMVEMKLRNPAVTTREIGKVVGRHHATVSRALKRYGIESKSVKDFRDNRANVLAGYQDRILRAIDDESLKKASLKDKVVSVGILYDKEALETGRSTHNVSFAGIVGMIEKEEKEKKKTD